MFVHYAAAPIVDGWVTPWDELTPEQRESAGHEARVHEAPQYRSQWRSDRVYVAQLANCGQIFRLGTGYANPDHWVYAVEPIGKPETDPESQHQPGLGRSSELGSSLAYGPQGRRHFDRASSTMPAVDHFTLPAIWGPEPGAMGPGGSSVIIDRSPRPVILREDAAAVNVGATFGHAPSGSSIAAS